MGIKKTRYRFQRLSKREKETRLQEYKHQLEKRFNKTEPEHPPVKPSEFEDLGIDPKEQGY